jgi:hypothetical protein
MKLSATTYNIVKNQEGGIYSPRYSKIPISIGDRIFWNEDTKRLEARKRAPKNGHATVGRIVGMGKGYECFIPIPSAAQAET